MSTRTQYKTVAVIAVIALLTIFTLQNRVAVPLEELRKRVETSTPLWANYEEDIKAQIGATPAAQWEGKPVSARIDGANLYVDFEIAGPWVARKLALPLLAHDPLGNTYQNTGAEIDGAQTIYVFVLTEDAARDGLPWVDLKYPHHERRLVFSDDGDWEAVIE